MQKNGGEFFKGEAHRQILKRTSHDNLHCCQSQGNSKKKKNICGSVLKHVRGVILIRYGGMALYWRILMDLMMGSGLKDTDAQSAAQS